MFRVDHSKNRLSRFAQKRFSELALRERDHLQEWLAKQPDAYVEPYLTIRTGFNRFDETGDQFKEGA